MILCNKCRLWANQDPLKLESDICERCFGIPRKTVYIDLDGVVADFDSEVIGLTEEEKRAKMSEKYFFQELNPVKGAIESLRWLDQHFDVYLLSTASWESYLCWTEKRLWVDMWIPEFRKRLILTHHKHLNKGDYLIDDRMANGAGSFQGCLLPFGSKLLPDWKSVIEFMKNAEGIYD